MLKELDYNISFFICGTIDLEELSRSIGVLSISACRFLMFGVIICQKLCPQAKYLLMLAICLFNSKMLMSVGIR